jgi:hypothetical protein
MAQQRGDESYRFGDQIVAEVAGDVTGDGGARVSQQASEQARLPGNTPGARNSPATTWLRRRVAEVNRGKTLSR